MLPEVRVASSEIAAAYAFVLADVPVVLPASIFMEYVASVQVQPLPRAAERVVGLIQRRGTIVPVFDPVARHASRSIGKAVSILVVGDGPNTAAVLIEAQPQLATALQSADSHKKSSLHGAHDCVFASALSSTFLLGEEGVPHRLLDPEALFLSLSKNGYLS